MVARVAEFGQVYSALTATKRKIPVRVLRFFKEQLYELVHAPAGNEKKLAVLDFEEIDSADSVEFVVGVGVARRQEELGQKVDQAVQSALSKKGYAGISPDEIFTDCLLDKSRFSAEGLLGSAFPNLARSHRTFIPIFRYLDAAGIKSDDALLASKYEGAKKVVKKLKGADYALPSYAARYRNEFADHPTGEIIAKASNPKEACIMLGFQPAKAVDVAALRDFLRVNAGTFEDEPYRTAYRKLVCRYDRLAFGF